MASNININGINVGFPVPGVNNDSQGFRDNFASIASNLNIAKDEITALQNTTFKTDSDNDFNGSQITDAQFKSVTEVSFSGNITTDPFVINFNNGHYQKFTVNSNIPELNITLTGWPGDGRYAVLRLELSSTGSVNVLFSVDNQGVLKLDYNWPKRIILRPEPVVLEFYTLNGGQTVYGRYLYRSYDIESHPFANQEGSELVIFNVRVSDDGSGVQDTFFLNDNLLTETPELYFTPGTRYRFILEHPSNTIAPLRFSTTPDTAVPASITPYTDNVTIDGVAGQPNAYIELEVTDDTPVPLYLYAQEMPNGLDTSGMGKSLAIGPNPSYVRIAIANKLQDADADTYIICETEYEADNDTIDFYSNGVKKMFLNENRLELVNGTKLDIRDTSADALRVNGGAQIAGDLVLGGNLIYNPTTKRSLISNHTMPQEYTDILGFASDSLINVSFYDVGDSLKLFGASDNSTKEAGTGLVLTTVEKVGLDPTVLGITPGGSEFFSYKIAEFNLLNGGISVATAKTSVEIDPGVKESFNLDNNIKLTFSRTDSGKGILIYRAIGTGNEANLDYNLVAILGPKDLTTELSGIIWIDYFTYEQNSWSRTDGNNTFTQGSGILHMPINPPSAALYGWVDVKITEKLGSTVKLDRPLYHNDTLVSVTDDTENLQTDINARASQGVNFIELDNRNHYVSSLVIPPNFSIYGKGKESKLTKQYWSTDFNANTNLMIIPSVNDSSFQSVVFENFKIDGNFLNQYLLQDTTNVTVNRNYCVYLFGNSLYLEDIEIKNTVGGGLFLYNVTDEQLVTENVIIKDSIIQNGVASYRYDTYSPIKAGELRNSKITTTTFKNYPSSADFTAATTVVLTANIIENCGSGLLTYGSVNSIYTPNIILGPAGEFLPVTDVLNTEYDSVNIVIEPDIDYNSYRGLYQENGVAFDLTENDISLEGKINDLVKINGVETLGTDRSLDTSNISRIQITQPGTQGSALDFANGVFDFRIVAANTTDLIAIDLDIKNKNSQNYNADYEGLVYRIIATEYVPKATINSASVSATTATVLVNAIGDFKLNDIVRVKSNTTPDVGGIDARITGINSINKSITVEYDVANTGPFTAGTSGTLNLKNRFVLVKGKIN